MQEAKKWTFVNIAAVSLLATLSACGSSGSWESGGQIGSPAIVSASVSSASLTAPAKLTVTATAASGFGTVVKVEYFNGATKLGEVNEPPYVFVWKNAAVGTYDITVVAHNSLGRSASKTVGVTVTEGTLVLIDGGTFIMGDDTNAKTAPAHPVTVSGFYLSKYELTFTEYDAFTADAGRPEVADAYDTGRGNKPVYDVSWYDAIEYCNWRSTQEGLTLVYTIDRTRKDPNNTSTVDSLKWTVTANLTADGYRLPTDAEWEFAAKGGIKHQGFIYSGSNDVNEVAWYGGKAVAAGTSAGNVNARGDLRAIGSKKANELGLYDMSGNVHEWIWDKYDTTRPGYADSSAGKTEVNPTGITGMFDKFVFRGGNSGGRPDCMLVSKRFTKDPTFVMCPAGIRLARSR